MALWTRRLRRVYLLAAVIILSFFGVNRTIIFKHVLLIDYPDVGKSREDYPFEIEGLALGPAFTRSSDSLAEKGHVPWFIESLQSRFQRTMFPDGDGEIGYPSCRLDPARYGNTAFMPRQSRWWNNRRQSIVSFAINLHDSEKIIPAQAIALLEAIAYLLQSNKVYVSIYENGSEDKTRALLSDVGAALQAIGVDGVWIHSSNMLSDFGRHDRIVMLSEIRNLALAPLVPYASSEKGGDTLLVMNDVLTCSSDILELVHQQRFQHADMAFGTDWISWDRRIRPGEQGYLNDDDPRYIPDNPPHTRVSLLYDTWVGRGISGNGVYDFARPGGFSMKSENESWVIDAYSTEDGTVHQRWLEGYAFPVYSGWGGMSAFDASLFTREHLRFRSTVTAGWAGGSTVGALGFWGRLISSEGYLESDCPGASECELVARDVWNMRQGRARIVLAPQARTTYNMADWLIMNDSVPVIRREGADVLNEDKLDWNEYTIPESVVCIATRTERGEWIDPWGETNNRSRLDPCGGRDCIWEAAENQQVTLMST